MVNVITPRTLLEQLVVKCGSLSAAARSSDIDRATLKRIRRGATNAPHTNTVAKIVKALND